MKRLLPAALSTLALSTPAFAHEALADHAHPHGDWGLAAMALLVGGIAAVSGLAPRLKARNKRNERS